MEVQAPTYRCFAQKMRRRRIFGLVPDQAIQDLAGECRVWAIGATATIETNRGRINAAVPNTSMGSPIKLRGCFE